MVSAWYRRLFPRRHTGKGERIPTKCGFLRSGANNDPETNNYYNCVCVFRCVLSEVYSVCIFAYIAGKHTVFCVTSTGNLYLCIEDQNDSSF